MTEIKTYCDHCGKELNEIKDYTGIDFNCTSTYFSADLCGECYAKLDKVLLGFCKKSNYKDVRI